MMEDIEPHTKLPESYTMPISDERLLSDVNAHVVVPSNITVKQALQHWKKGHNRWGTAREWWWLMIEHGNGRFTALPLEQLRDLLIDTTSGVTADSLLYALPPAREATNFTQLPGVIVVRTVEKTSLSTASAVSLAENSPGNLLGVIENGKLVGILSRRMRNFAMANLSLLNLLEEMESQEATVAKPVSDTPDKAS
jgi:hypothetical protein